MWPVGHLKRLGRKTTDWGQNALGVDADYQHAIEAWWKQAGYVVRRRIASPQRDKIQVGAGKSTTLAAKPVWEMAGVGGFQILQSSPLWREFFGSLRRIFLQMKTPRRPAKEMAWHVFEQWRVRPDPATLRLYESNAE